MTEAAAYRREYEVAWGDLDANAHLRNTAFFDYAAQTRFAFFAENGFPAERFQELRIGPVAIEERIRYVRELKLLEQFTVDLRLVSASEDGARFELENRFFRPDGARCAVLTTSTAWFDLDARRVIPAPADLRAAMDRLPRAENFRVLDARPAP